MMKIAVKLFLSFLLCVVSIWKAIAKNADADHLQQHANCGAGTVFDTTTKACICNVHPSFAPMHDNDRNLETEQDMMDIKIAGLFDMTSFDWGQEIFDYTLSLINDHNDGWYDDVLNDGTTLSSVFEDTACDGTEAARAYWDIRSNALSGEPPMAVVGARCSSASIAIARIAGLEGVPQVSPSSTSAQLSNKEEFPFFSRMLGPDDSRGQVGAFVSLLQFFGWDRVSIMYTDTKYSRDLATRFRSIWGGNVAYSSSIPLNSDGTISSDSIQKVLNGAPTNDPTVNSRIVLLIAHDHHAYSILATAKSIGFQPDTVWVGSQAWYDRSPPDFSAPNYSQGYLGITPERNRDGLVYQDFLQRLQTAQEKAGGDVFEDLPDYSTAHVVDSILSLAMAFSRVPISERRNGTRVVSELRSLSFDGVSGEVAFTESGDRQNPQYSIMNAQLQEDGTLKWVDVGRTGAEGDTFLGEEGVRGICFAEIGCQQSQAPLDSYPVPAEKLPVWVIIVILIIISLLFFVGFRYLRSKRKKHLMRKSMTKMQATMEKMKKIDDDLMGVGADLDAAKKRQASLIAQRALLQEKPDTWTDTDETLVEVSPSDNEHWDVVDRLQATMKDAHISKLWRIQNTSLWTYYSFHKDRLSMDLVDPNERSVWHGTSSLDPSVIYNDRQDGFMMQFSNKGLWGRGIYFADKSKYSHNYSHTPRALGFGGNERPRANEGEREMFLANLLVGDSIFMDRDKNSVVASECNKLIVPPDNSATKRRFNTVTGNTADSQVWIVYENGRAYPNYLVRYYRGKRDPKRTPYGSRKEATRANKIPEQAPPAGNLLTGNNTSDNKDQYVWEYKDNNGWALYESAHQSILENNFKAFTDGGRVIGAPNSIVQIRTDEWSYEVDLIAMVQTNLEHSDRKERAVRRRLLSTTSDAPVHNASGSSSVMFRMLGMSN